MKHIYQLFFFFLFLIFSLPSFSQKQLDGNFTDAGRNNRSIAYRVFYPENLENKYPVIIFSHGLGGSVDAGNYLGKHLAAHHFIVIHIQHPGSDRSLFENEEGVRNQLKALKQSLNNPQNALERFADIPFVIDRLEEWNKQNEIFAGHIDMKAIGMAGHSYGAVSTMIAAGQNQSALFNYKEDRIKAFLPLSPNKPKRTPRGGLELAYQSVHSPVLHITGTKDDNPLERGSFDPKDRTVPYQTLQADNQFLLVIDGADHSSFSARHFGDPTTDKVNEVGLLFFNAFLKGDKSSFHQLKKKQFVNLEEKDSFEYKNLNKSAVKE